MKSAEREMNERISKLISLGVLKTVIDARGVGTIGGGFFYVFPYYLLNFKFS